MEIAEADSEFERTNQFAQYDFGQTGVTNNQGEQQKKQEAEPIIEEEPPISEEEIKTREEQVKQLETFLHESGLKLSFQIIFTEIVQNGIPEEDVYKYTAQRLRQIGQTLSKATSKPAEPAPPEIKEPPKEVSEQ